MKVLMVVRSAGRDPWLSIEEDGQIQTFASAFPDGVEMIWMQGNMELDSHPVSLLASRLNDFLLGLFHHPKRKVRLLRQLLSDFGLVKVFLRLLFYSFQAILPGESNLVVPGLSPNRFTLNTPTHIGFTPVKQALLFRHVVQHYGFDYLVLTTSTCYWRFGELQRFLGRVPSTRFYGGDLLELAGIPFISGAGTILSRDVAEGVVLAGRTLRPDLFDDVALGDLVRAHNLAKPTHIPRVDVSSIEDIPADPKLAWEGQFLIRCKAEAVTQNPQPAIDLLHAVHSSLRSTSPST